MSGGHYSNARLRRGVLHFLGGKVVSAGLSFVGLLLVARLLPMAEYGRYVALVALVELLLGLANGGLDWVSNRYVPEYRVQAGGRELVRFVARLSALQGALLLAAAGLMAVLAPALVGMLSLGEASLPALPLYAAYLVLEGCSRVLRDQMLGQLLLQGRAQLALVARHLLWVGACAALWLGPGHATLLQVALVELAAGALGFALAALGLGLALREARREPEPNPGVAAWRPPAVTELRRLAWNSYAAFLLNIPARPQVLMLLVTRWAGLEAAGLYGFARSLADQVLRFLPAELLLGFVRPALVARYVADPDAQALNTQTNRLLVLSLMVLAPVLVVVLAQASVVVQVLGGARYAGSAPLLALLLCGAALFSHRRMLEFVANTVGCPEAIRRASLGLLAVPAASAMLLLAQAPLWSVPVAALAGEVLFGWQAQRALRSVGTPYAPPLAAVLRTALAVLGAALLLAMLAVRPSLPMLTGLALLALLLAAAGLALSRPLDAAAVAAMRALWSKRQGDKE